MQGSISKSQTDRAQLLARAGWPVALGLIAATVPGGGQAVAADIAYSMTAASANFSGVNWAPGQDPAAAPTQAAFGTDTLFFGGTSTFTTLNNDLTNAAFAGITFNSNAAAYTINGNAFTLGGNVVSDSANNQVLNPNITLDAVRTVTANSTSGSVTLFGTLGGTGGLIKNGTGTLVLRSNGGATATGQNTFSGGIVVNAGSVIANRTTATALGTGLVTVASGANVTIAEHAGGSQANYTNAFSLAGSGVNGGGALRFSNSGGFSVTGAIGISGGTTIATDPSTQTTTSEVIFTQPITGGGGLTLMAQGSAAGGTPRIRFDGASTYTGDTILTSSGVNTTPFRVWLQASANRLPSTTNLIFGGTPAGSPSGTFDKSVTLGINNTTQTVAGLSTANTPAAGHAYRIVSLHATNTAVFTITNTADNTFNGSFGGGTDASITNPNNIRIVKTGGGILTLGGSSTFTQGTTIGVTGADTTTGQIRVTNSNAFGTGPVALASTSTSSISGVLLQGGISLPSTNTLSIGAARGVSLSAASASPILRNVSGDNTFAGAVNILAGSGGGVYIASDANTLTLSGNLGSVTASSIYGFNGPGNINVTGNITTTTAGQVVKLGGGLLTLGGTNTYTGQTTIGNTLSDGTAVRATSNGALGSGAGTVLINAGTGSGAAPSLQLAGGITLSNPITATLRNIANSTPEFLNVSGDNTLQGNIASTLTSGGNGFIIQSDSGTLTLNGNLSFANAATYVFQGAGNTTVNGSLASATGGGLNKLGGGTLRLNGSNGYTGTTTVSGGTLAIGNGGTTGTLGTGAVAMSNASNLTFNRSNAYGLINVISGAGSVAQSGAGTTTLSGTNTYTAGTTISGGTLRADNGTPTSGSSLGSGPVAVNAGGTLAGIGKTGGGVVTVNAGSTTVGGTVTAGTGATAADTPGTLGSGNQVWKGGPALAATPTTAGGRFVVKFQDSTAGVANVGNTASVGGTAGTWDQLTTGTLDLTNLSGTNKFNLVLVKVAGGTFDTLTSQSFVLASGTNILTSAAPTGVAANTDLTDLFALDTSGLSLPDSTPFSVVSGASGGDLVLSYSAAPEPTTSALVGLSGSVLLGRRRRLSRI